MGSVYPHLKYGIILCESSSVQNIQRVFILQKKAIQLVTGLKNSDTCTYVFKEIRVHTLSCLYILQVLLYFKL